jgi:aminoglycoside phosphotransferase (APT) family kinase protein
VFTRPSRCSSSKPFRAGRQLQFSFLDQGETLVPARKTHAEHPDVEIVRRLLAAQFPEWADLPIRPVEKDGWDNTSFRLGDEMSVRLPSHEAYAAQVDKEHQWLPRLAPLLPLPIPVPVAKGAPTPDFPLPWSVYRWIDGEIAPVARIDDMTAFARALAEFLVALQEVDAGDGPPPGWHNFFRGGPLTTWCPPSPLSDCQTIDAIAALRGKIDAHAATQVWEKALDATWHGMPVWVHGDVAADNLLVRDGRLAAVIDFGCSGVGDPACDLVIAWTFLSGQSRAAFRVGLPLDEATWARGRGWALWKALIVLAREIDTGSEEETSSRRALGEVLMDHESVVASQLHPATR